MLFRKDIEPRCAWCKYAGTLSDGMIACPKKGIVEAGSSCGKFVYDPLKRVPVRGSLPKTDKLSPADFSLD